MKNLHTGLCKQCIRLRKNTHLDKRAYENFAHNSKNRRIIQAIGAMNPNSPEFIALRDFWYARLREEGFKDIESIQPGAPTRPSPRLNRYASTHLERLLEGLEAGGRGAYLEAAQYYLEHGAWIGRQGRNDRELWELHASGLDTADIERKLADRTTRRTQHYIRKRIKTLQERMLNAIAYNISYRKGESSQNLKAFSIFGTEVWSTTGRRGNK